MAALFGQPECGYLFALISPNRVGKGKQNKQQRIMAGKIKFYDNANVIKLVQGVLYCMNHL